MIRLGPPRHGVLLDRWTAGFFPNAPYEDKALRHLSDHMTAVELHHCTHWTSSTPQRRSVLH
ncbi:hypothetical protein EYF80_022559 [Liparis tanakae]|uniref:Uncharacterized protein n=1 Tax=Liparis tanakae TaxID=230148 RepID=A0A4Z2HNT3_9TELE|nr:hypothetical protein EYF80_022559 [Liparis tanakae]